MPSDFERRGGRARSRRRRGARRSRAAPRTIRTRLRRASIVRHGRRSTPTRTGRSTTAPSRALFARLDIQDGGRARRTRRRHHHAGFPRELPGAREFLRPRLQVLARRAATASIDLRHAIEQSCDVYFYTVANMVGVDKINKWATALGLGVKSGIDLPERSRRGSFRRPSGSARKCTRSGMRAKRFRSASAGAGVGDAGLDGRVHGDARQRRHARHAASAQSGRRWQRVEAVPPPPPQSEIDIDPEKLQAIRDGLWMVVNGAAAPAARARIAGHDVVGQDRHRAGDLEYRASAARQDRKATCATTAGSCFSRRAIIRRSPAWCFSNMAFTAATRRWSRTTSSIRFSRRRTAGRCLLRRRCR